MEGNNFKKNNNQISTVLLVVGVIFILIAGSIFVTTAWQSLSENGKRIILTAVVAGLYTVSWKLREKEFFQRQSTRYIIWQQREPDLLQFQC